MLSVRRQYGIPSLHSYISSDWPFKVPEFIGRKLKKGSKITVNQQLGFSIPNKNLR